MNSSSPSAATAHPAGRFAPANPVLPNVRKLTPRQAAKESKVSIWTIYRLVHSGLVKAERPGPNTILIIADSLAAHLKATAEDPEFWS